jgi:hypothetical protein
MIYSKSVRELAHDEYIIKQALIYLQMKKVTDQKV